MVKPVRNVSAGGQHYWIALGLVKVFVQKLGQIEDLAKEGHPAVVHGVVLGHLCRGVEAAQLVRPRNVLGILDFGDARFTGRWHSCSHIDFLCFVLKLFYLLKLSNMANLFFHLVGNHHRS